LIADKIFAHIVRTGTHYIGLKTDEQRRYRQDSDTSPIPAQRGTLESIHLAFKLIELLRGGWLAFPYSRAASRFLISAPLAVVLDVLFQGGAFFLMLDLV
jgi:hypothetical protein